MAPAIRTALATSAMLGWASAAQGCSDLAPFEIADIRRADAIFSGQLVDYQRVSPERPQTLGDYGLLTIRLDKVIKGRVPRTVQLYWWNSTFAVPETLAIETPLLIGAVKAARPDLPLRGASATVYPTRRPDLLQLMQAPCSAPFRLDGTSQNIENVRMILRGESVPPHDYFALQTAEALRQLAIVREAEAKTSLVTTVLGGIGAALAGVVLAAWLAARRKRWLRLGR